MIGLCLTRGCTAELRQRYPTLRSVPVIEVPERLTAQGKVHYALDEEMLYVQLYEARQRGMEQAVVALLHAMLCPEVEQRVRAVALHLGFSQVWLSHQGFEHSWWERLEAVLAAAHIQAQPAVKGLDIELLEQQYPCLLKHSSEKYDFSNGQVIALERYFECLAPMPIEELSHSLMSQLKFVRRATTTLETQLASHLWLNTGDHFGLATTPNALANKT